MEQQIKLVAKILFHDSLSKRNIPQGVMFYADNERAVKLVEGGFASIMERPKRLEAPAEVKAVTTVVTEKPKEVKPDKPAKSVTKRVAKRKQVK